MLFVHLQRMGVAFYTRTKTGEITARLQNDVRGAQSAITTTFVSVMTNTITVCMAVALLLSVDVRLTLISLSVVPFFFIPATIVAKKIRIVTEDMMTAFGTVYTLLIDISMTALVQYIPYS